MMRRVFVIVIFFIGTILVLRESFAKEPLNIDLAKQEVIRYHDSGEYERDIKNIVVKAKLRLEKYVKKSTNPQKLAMILDIDDTAISTFDYKKNMGFGFTEKTYEEAILHHNWPAIKPVLDLYNFARLRGVSVFFISSRPKSCYNATIRQLKRAGYKKWNGLFLEPDNYNFTTAVFKAKVRKGITLKGYKIIANIGDQYTDFYTSNVSCNFKLPNPFYIDLINYSESTSQFLTNNL